MNNMVWLKWGSLKGYNFDDDFVEKNRKEVEELSNVWDKIYEKHCSATGGSDEVQNNYDLKIELINVLEKLFNLGVVFQNDWSDEYYNTFDEIKDYILNYGE
jgi:hypothetical protein